MIRLPRALRPKKTRPARVLSTERKPIVRLEKPEHDRGRRQERQGKVVSDAMEKTIVVEVSVVKAHPKYKKVVRRSVKFHAHDERSEAKVGDLVRTADEGHAEMGREPVEIAPISAGKNDPRLAAAELEPALDDLLRHQRGDLYADVHELPREVRLAETGKQPHQPRPGQVSGDEDQPFSQRLPVLPGACGSQP